MRILTCWILASLVISIFSGCSLQAETGRPGTSDVPTAESHSAPGNWKVITSAAYDIRVCYPADLELRQSFRKSYLANGRWKTYTGPGSPSGKPLIALIMPASNQVTSGELRIGVSHDPAAIRTCKEIPASARPGSVGEMMIDGIPFTTFQASDAGMSHYLLVHSYRAVHAETCYAMDVLVFGSNPNVYSPPKTPPFTREQVLTRLIPVAEGLQFIEAPTEAATVLSPMSLPVTYQGLIPCADCPGIDYHLNLLPDHRYALRMSYRDREAQFDEQGRWQLSGNGKVLILRDENFQPRQWAVQKNGQRLRMLDLEGHVVQSQLNYDLTRQAQFQQLDSGDQASD